MRWITLAALAALVLAAAGHFVASRASVHAGTALRMELADLAQRADLALEGRVVSKTASIGAGGRIETEYCIRAERTLVGAAQAIHVVRMPGGVLPDGRGLLLSGMPHVEAGEDVLLFLTAPDTRGARMPVGLAQGKLRVVRTTDGTKRLVRLAGGLDLASPGGEVRSADRQSVLDYATAMTEITTALAVRAANREVRR